MQNKLQTRKLDEDEYEEWDKLVAQSTFGTIFHDSEWLNLNSKFFNKKLNFYGCFENGELIGGCPIFLNNKSNFLKVASSTCKLIPYNGVLIKTSDSPKVTKQERNRAEIINSLINSFDSSNFDHIRIHNSPALDDIRFFSWHGWNSIINYAYYLDLKNTEDIYLSPDAKRNIKKAENESIITEKSSDIESFSVLYKDNYKRQNIKPPGNKHFFKKMFDMLVRREMGELWTAKTTSGELAAAEIFIYDKHCVYRWCAATEYELRQTGAYVLLLWDVFKDLGSRGFSKINLMAANTPHLANFIIKFNPRLVPNYGVEKCSIKFDLMKLFKKIFKK